MATELAFMSWNVLDDLNNPEVQREILAGEPDVGVFPEAAREEIGATPDTVRAFTNAGYDLYQVPYHDTDGRLDRHTLAVVIKPELLNDIQAVRLAGRSALLLNVAEDVDVMAVHLDDRLEVTRFRQTRRVLELLGDTAVSIGDHNALYRNRPRSRVLRVAEPLSRLVPAIDPNPNIRPPKLKRIASLAQRTAAIADGSTMEKFVRAGFRDAAEDDKPTMKKGPLSISVDRILYRGNLSVVDPTSLHGNYEHSDHRQLRARLAVAK